MHHRNDHKKRLTSASLFLKTRYFVSFEEGILSYF